MASDSDAINHTSGNGLSEEIKKFEEIKKAVEAERERCAQIADRWLDIFGAVNPETIDAQTWACDAVRDIADRIRNPLH